LIQSGGNVGCPAETCLPDPRPLLSAHQLAMIKHDCSQIDRASREEEPAHPYRLHLGISSGPIHFSVRIGLFGSGRGHQNEACPAGWGGQPNGPTIYCPPRRHASLDGGDTAPGAKFRRVALLPPEFSWGALANVSRRPFPRACQHFPLVLAGL
jgi:hypothetical protein